MYFQNVASITIKIGTCLFKTSSFTFLFSYSKRRANIYPLTSFLLKSIIVIFICSQYEAHIKLLTRGSTYGLCMFSFIFWPDNGRHLRKREPWVCIEGHEMWSPLSVDCGLGAMAESTNTWMWWRKVFSLYTKPNKTNTKWYQIVVTLLRFWVKCSFKLEIWGKIWPGGASGVEERPEGIGQTENKQGKIPGFLI